MNLLQLRYMAAVAEYGSLNKAAVALYMTQPNLSGAIRNLEKELDVKLFDRTNNGMVITEEGQDFLKYAKRILGEIKLLEERYQKDFLKSFTVSSHHYDFLSEPLAYVAEIYEDDYQDFQLIETTTRQILESVASYESDLGIIYLNDENRHFLTRHITNLDLEFTSLGDFQTRIFLGKNHPLAQQELISEEDLTTYPQIRFQQEKTGMHFDEDPLEINHYQRIIYSNDRGTVMNLLRASDAYASGLGIVNSFMREQIVLVPLKDSPLHTLGYVRPKKAKSSAIIDSFISQVQKSLAEFRDYEEN
ncbi:LysR family transcriptional regulator [Streptococcus dentapri]|uniref:LysR family transcriptional regulator n=1 Tax=Streptococcus dentapri TaxID=573564 RepID=A0ABV8CYE2_9STRE